MTLAELKEWINSLPDELLQFPVMSGIEGEFDNEFFYRVDEPIVASVVDMDTEEVIFLGRFDESQLTEDDRVEIAKLWIMRE